MRSLWTLPQKGLTQNAVRGRSGHVANRRQTQRHRTDQRKIDEVSEIARRWSAARRIYARDYAGVEHLALVLAKPKKISLDRARSGWADVDLNYHYHKTACESALAILKGGWESTFTRVRSLIGRSRRFSAAERHELFYLLKAPALLQQVLLGETPESLATKPEFATNDHPRLCAYLRRMVLRQRTAHPRLARSDGFEMDNTAYRPFTRVGDRHFQGVWTTVSGLTKGKTIKIPLAGKDLRYLDQATKRNVRVRIVGGRIALQIPHEIETPAESVARTAVVGIDKGYRVLLAAATSDDPQQSRLYGEDFGDLCSKIDDAQQRRAKNRDRLRSHQRNLAGQAKAKRVARQNLRGAKQVRRLVAEKARIANAVGQGVNAFFADHPTMGVLVEERLTFQSNKNLGRTWNRRLAGWVKGDLAKSLDNKTSAHGVRRELVNPAYTSQACPDCGHAEKANRNKQVFRCRDCGYDAHADRVASSNVRSRYGDLEITLWTPKAEVKAILDRRRQAVVRSATRGSNSTILEIAGRAVNTLDTLAA